MAIEHATERVIIVGVAQFRVERAPVSLVTMALGSCLGIVLYEPASRIGALAHAMHPTRERVKNNANRSKFVDSVIPILVDRMVREGARRENIVAKLFGGARMFESYKGCRGVAQIGDENVNSARRMLKEMNIPVVGECVGGTNGRTIAFDLETGKVMVRDSNGKEAMY